MILSAFLLTYDLNSKNLWTDEITSVDISSKNVGAIIEWTAVDVHPPLYYIFLHYWKKVFGETEIVSRTFSTIFAILSVLLVYGIGSLLVNRNFGLLSGFLFSISPLLILRASMIRWYSSATFFGLLSIWAFLKAIKEDKLWMWITYTIASTCLIYIHYLPFSLLAGQNIYILIFRSKYKGILKKWYLSQLCILIFYMPQITTLIKQLLYAPHHGSAAPLAYGLKGAMVKIGYPLYAFCFGETILPWNFLITIPLSILYMFLFINGIWKFFIEKENLIFVLSFFFLPILFLLLITGTIFPSESFHIFPGLLLFVLPIFYLIIARGIYSLRRKDLQIVMLVLIIFTSGYSLKNYYQGKEYINPNYMIPWKQISRDLKSEVSKNDLVIATDIMLYYYRRNLPMLLMDEPFTRNEVEEYIEKNVPEKIWFQIRDSGDYTGSKWKLEFSDWLNKNYGYGIGERGYVEEDKATIFFKEKLLKRPVPKYKIIIYKYTKKYASN